MTRLYVFVEGGTELDFVKHCLAPHLNARGIWTVGIEVTTKRERGAKLARGGGHWKHWHRDIGWLLRSQSGADVRVTSLFDLYGLPRDFPELDMHRAIQDTQRRAQLLEESMSKSIDDSRFIPYLQRHEFEALVLASLDQLPELLEDEIDRTGVESLRVSLQGCAPEDVNDGEDTAPSKRLIANVPGYRKATHGPLVTGAAGLAFLRSKCPRFDAWVTQLESLRTVQP